MGGDDVKLRFFAKHEDEALAATLDRDGIVEGQTREENSKVKIKPNRTLAESFFYWASAALYAIFGLILVLTLLLGVFQYGAHHEKKRLAFSSRNLPTFEPAIDWGRLPKWTAAADPAFMRSVVADADKFSTSPFDQFALGVHERDNGSLSKSYYYLTLAAARAHPDARRLRDQINLSTQDRRAAMQRFGQTLTFGGSDANFLLGMMLLGDGAFELARRPDAARCDRRDELRQEPTWPPCEDNFRLPGASRLPWPNDLLAEGISVKDSYRALARAAQCFHAEAPLWLNAIENYGWIDQVTAEALRAQASNEVQNGGKREEFCNGNVWITGRPDREFPASPGVDPSGYCRIAEGDGALKAQRDRPGRSGYNPADDAEEGALCAAGAPGCADSADALAASDEARVCLRMGDAMLAAGDVDFAFQFYRAAIARGRKYGAQAAIAAGDRLRALSLTCEYSTKSLARIARGQLGSDFINIVDRQRALKALGYYNGGADGKWGEQTRESVRVFQRELGFDETGALSPLETVVLICQAAESKGDPDAQNLLGVMYAAGLGVVQNTDLALEWLNAAARRGSADAYYNLAIIYATGTILSSYRLCDARFNDELAEAFHSDARRLGHPRARGETFQAFKLRVIKENNTSLEIVTPSCGDVQQDPGTGQNK